MRSSKFPAFALGLLMSSLTTIALAQTTTSETVTSSTQTTVAPPGTTIAAPAPAVPAPEKNVFFKVIGGTSDLALGDTDPLDSFADGTALNFNVEVGSKAVTFQTGLFFMQTQIENDLGNSPETKLWGIPAEVKFNFMGNPQSTVYAKAGVSLLEDTHNFAEDIDLMGRAGLGFAVPIISRDLAIVVEAEYDWVMTREIFNEQVSGYNFMAGLSAAL